MAAEREAAGQQPASPTAPVRGTAVQIGNLPGARR